MALRLSTALRNRVLGEKTSLTDAGSQIAFVNGTAKITDTESRFLDEGFRPGDVIIVSDSSGGTNDGYYSVTSVASTGADMVVSPAPTTEAAAAATPTIACVHVKGLLDLLKDGKLDIYSGSQPADGDAAETGTKLVSITVEAGAFTKGTATNGLEFDAPSEGKLPKAAAETWQGEAIATGTGGWFRFYDNAYATGVDADDEAIRLDGSVGTSGAQLEVSSTSITTGATITVDTFGITLPAS